MVITYKETKDVRAEREQASSPDPASNDRTKILRESSE